MSEKKTYSMDDKISNKRSYSSSRSDSRRPRRTYDDSEYKWGKEENTQSEPIEPEMPIKKAKPTDKLSGLLSKDKRTTETGGVLKFEVPPEARKPKIRWRLYPFKNGESLEPYYLHRQPYYLFGRDRDIADIPLDHPSCSKQHAVIVYREIVSQDKETLKKTSTIKPYVMDLGSTHGTFLNDVKLDDKRYVELFEKDCIKFGYSTREYVFIEEK